MSSNGCPYDLRQLPAATEQIKKLGKKAAKKGLKEEFLNALKSILEELQAEPKEAGDPLHRLHKPGALMYHGVFGPLFVQYAVFEQENIVLILKVIAMPSSPLDIP
jgi:mRNA-degrading endonuclease RelE of RelBE toxin-antitoxin system